MPAPASTPAANADPAQTAPVDQDNAGQQLWEETGRSGYLPENGLPTRGERARILLFAAIGPLVAGYLILAALLALIVAIAPGGAISPLGILAATGPTWLAAMHVQLIISGHPLGMLPLLPTVLLLWLAARASAGAADCLGAATPTAARPIFLAVGLGNGAFAALLSSVGSGHEVSSSPVLAFVLAALLSCFAVAAGLSRRCGLVSAVLSRADEPTRSGLRAGLLGLAGLLAVGALLYALALALSLPTVAGMFGTDGFGGGLGILLLSLAYLPNAVIGALSFAVGPGFSIGAMVVRPLAFHSGPVLGLPLLGALPVRPAPWWLVAFLLPAAVGVGVGWACRRVTDPVSPRSRRTGAEPRPDRALGRLRAVGVAAVTVGVGCLALAALAGGTVADGPFNPVTIQAGLLALTAFGWIGIIGAATALVAGPHPDVLVALATRMADAITDPDDEADPDSSDAEDHARDRPDQDDDQAEPADEEEVDEQDEEEQDDEEADEADVDGAETAEEEPAEKNVTNESAKSAESTKPTEAPPDAE
ncbi:MAG TPA: DUF6350 family protein [Pseudonocardiaceae bacterium]|jgi:hypothetical protein|nr:DUF6350 family protein [Pseudonocardiaceae bacterium]